MSIDLHATPLYYVSMMPWVQANIFAADTILFNCCGLIYLFLFIPEELEIVAGNPGVFQLYPYPYPPNPYPWPRVRVLEGRGKGLHGFGGFGGFDKFCGLMSQKTYIFPEENIIHVTC